MYTHQIACRDTLKFLTSDPVENYIQTRTAKGDRRMRLRRMNASEVVDVAITAFRSLAWTFLKFTAVPALYCLAALYFLIHFLIADLFVTTHTSVRDQVLEMGGKIAVATLVAGPLFLIGVCWISCGVTILTSEWMLGNVSNQDQASKRALAALPKVLFASFRVALVSSSGVIVSLALLFVSSLLSTNADTEASLISIIGVFGIIVGILVQLYVVLSHALVPVIVALESSSAKVASKRSKALLADRSFGQSGTEMLLRLVLIVFFLLCAVAVGVSAILSYIDIHGVVTSLLPSTGAGAIIGEMVDLLPGFILLWLLSPFWSVATTVIYYENRVRIEAFDIEVLAEEMTSVEGRARYQV